MQPGRYSSVVPPTFADRYLDQTPWGRHSYPVSPVDYEVDATLEADREVLLEHLRGVLSAGRRVPCVFWSGVDDCWTSDFPTQQSRAAALCGGCPALAACADYARRHPAERGVYGGLTERQRRRLDDVDADRPCDGTG